MSTTSATLQGPRIALQLARAWCALVAPYGTGAVTIDGSTLEFSGQDSATRDGIELATVVFRREDEARAGEPFVCKGPGVGGPKGDIMAGAVEGPGLFMVEPGELYTKVLRPKDPVAFAKRYCAEWASKRGLAGIVGQSMLIADYREVLSRVEAELSTEEPTQGAP
jgi:hypothetical protein